VASRQKQVALGGIAIAAFAVTGYLLYAQSGGATEGVPREITVTGACLSCKTEGTWRFPLAEIPPHTCPSCQAAAIYPWLYCMDCSHKFIPRPEGSEHRMPAVPMCPKCRIASAVGAYIPDAYPVVGEPTLPVWP
jgi:hypothetical protein